MYTSELYGMPKLIGSGAAHVNRVMRPRSEQGGCPVGCRLL